MLCACELQGASVGVTRAGMSWCSQALKEGLSLRQLGDFLDRGVAGERLALLLAPFSFETLGLYISELHQQWVGILDLPALMIKKGSVGSDFGIRDLRVHRHMHAALNTACLGCAWGVGWVMGGRWIGITRAQGQSTDRQEQHKL